ncbi:MAG TPA: NAD(P)H-binding protein [Gaiellaceae bacterium]|nr:NAD(P)H-binding protein [Gaiellaceae bacterium]
MEPLDVVTGAFSYSGRYLARRLQENGRRVRTLTNNPAARDGEIEVRPLRFDDPVALVDALRGASTLYNTYWVRFAHGHANYERAVANTRALFAAARAAEIERVVHVSITNADESSPFPYFKWKGVLERELRESGLSHAIVRPTVIFGREDILINNIAWLLRKLPLFVVPTGGQYRLQPVYVEDLAELMSDVGARRDDMVVDAVGPETYRFDELVRVIRGAVGSRSPIVRLPPRIALTLSRLVGLAVRDVVLTRDEIDGLRANLLVSDEPPTGTTSFAAWTVEHGPELGRGYSSELARHYRR